MKKSLLMVVLAVAMMLVAAGTATADQVTIPGAGGPPLQAQAPVQVSATVGSRLELTVRTNGGSSQSVEFGPVVPGTPVNDTVELDVKSNHQFDMNITTAGDAELTGSLTRSLGTGFTNQARGSYTAAGLNGFQDDYTLNVPYSVAPGAYTATVTYTVVQD
jgi:opacity protein-like surface antigen